MSYSYYTLPNNDIERAINHIHSKKSHWLHIMLSMEKLSEERCSFVVQATNKMTDIGFHVVMVVRVKDFTETPEAFATKRYEMLRGIEPHQVSFVRFTSTLHANAGDTRNASFLVGDRVLSDARLSRQIEMTSVGDDNKAIEKINYWMVPKISPNCFTKTDSDTVVERLHMLSKALQNEPNAIVSPLPSYQCSKLATPKASGNRRKMSNNPESGKTSKDVFKMMQIWLMSPMTLHHVVEAIRVKLSEFALPIFEDYLLVNFLKEQGFEMELIPLLQRKNKFQNAGRKGESNSVARSRNVVTTSTYNRQMINTMANVLVKDTGFRLVFNKAELPKIIQEFGVQQIDALVENKDHVLAITRRLRLKFTSDVFPEQNLYGCFVYDSKQRKIGNYWTHALASLMVLGVAQPVTSSTSSSSSHSTRVKHKSVMHDDYPPRSPVKASPFTQLNVVQLHHIQKYTEATKQSRLNVTNQRRGLV